MKKYKVVQADVINPDDLLGLQEPIETEARDLVNIEDNTDRYMANPDDFPNVGEIILEGDFEVEERNYVDDQGFGTALFAFKIHK